MWETRFNNYLLFLCEKIQYIYGNDFKNIVLYLIYIFFKEVNIFQYIKNIILIIFH